MSPTKLLLWASTLFSHQTPSSYNITAEFFEDSKTGVVAMPGQDDYADDYVAELLKNDAKATSSAAMNSGLGSLLSKRQATHPNHLKRKEKISY